MCGPLLGNTNDLRNQLQCAIQISERSSDQLCPGGPTSWRLWIGSIDCNPVCGPTTIHAVVHWQLMLADDRVEDVGNDLGDAFTFHAEL
jgi:hypothetical protein